MSQRYTLRMWVAAGVLLVTGLTANADIIYDNGEPGGLNAWGSDAVYTQRIADNFMLNTGANVLTDIHWSGTYWLADPLPDMSVFTITIFTSAATAHIPDSVVWQATAAVARQDTGQCMWYGGEADYPENIMDIFEYDYLLDAPLVLNAKETYFLSILAEPSGLEDVSWYWCQVRDGGGAINTGDGWYNYVCEMAFHLTGGAGDVTPEPPTPPGGVVPEPATLSLMAIGLLGIAMRRRN